MEHLTAKWARLEATARLAPQRLFHFTSLMHLPAIESAGHLRTTESNIDISGAGPRVVWLTETSEPGGNGLTDGFKDQVRVTLDTGLLRGSLHWWPEWSRDQGIEDYWYAILEQTAGGSAENWWVVTAPIPLGLVDSIEVRRGSAWVEHEQ